MILLMKQSSRCKNNYFKKIDDELPMGITAIKSENPDWH